MQLNRGAIYLADIKNRDFPSGLRPVIIWVQYSPSNRIMVYPITSKISTGNSKRIYIDIKMGNRSIKSDIMCDYPLIINTNDINTHIGELPINIINQILKVTSQEEMSLKHVISSNHEMSDKNEVILTADKFEIIMNSLDELKSTVDMSNSPSAKWKERLIGFLFGILASVIASIIYSKLNR